MGYTPHVHQPDRHSDIPTLDKCLNSIKEARQAAQEAQHKAQESWVKDKPRYKPFAIGEQVWLEGTNLRLPANVTPKLSPRRYGPFKVAASISAVAYKLELPTHWKIHDVFHASLLTPYKEMSQHGPNFLEPPPDIIDGEPEWEIEQILQSRRYGHTKKKQYLVRWKGYSPSHDSWVDKSDMNAPDLVNEFYMSHPAAIHTCIKAMEAAENASSPQSMKCLLTPISPAQDFPLLPYSPLEPAWASSSSACTLMETNSTCSQPLSTSSNSISTSIGPHGYQEKIPQELFTMQSQSQLTNPFSPIELSIRHTSTQQNHSSSMYQDRRPYLRKNQTMAASTPSSQQTNNRKHKRETTPPTPQTVDTAALRREQCITHFKGLYQKWTQRNKQFRTTTVANWFRRNNKDTALFLYTFFRPLYDEATETIKAKEKGIMLPNPAHSQWSHLLENKAFLIMLRISMTRAGNNRSCVEPTSLGGTSCYNPPSFSFLSHPQMPTAPVAPPAPTVQAPQTVFPTALPQLMPLRARTPPLPTTFTQAIQAIPITWPTHTCHHSSMEYFTEPTAPATDPATNSDGDSPMRDRSPSPVHTPYQPRPSGSKTYELEANEQPSPPWKAWLSQPSSPTAITQPISPSSETSVPKRQRHDDGSYTLITSSATLPISPTSPSAQATPDYQSLPSPRSMGSDQDPNTESPPMLLE